MMTKTYMDQVDGRSVAAMAGSRGLIGWRNGLQMGLERKKPPANRWKWRVAENTNTYTMYFYRQSMTKHFDIKVKEIAKYEGVYFDMLQDIFTQVTGLYTRF